MSRLVEEIEAHLERVRVIEALAREDAKLKPDFRHHERALVEAFERARRQSDDERTQRSLERDYRERWSQFCIRHFVEELDWELLGDQNIDAGRWSSRSSAGATRSATIRRVCGSAVLKDLHQRATVGARG